MSFAFLFFFFWAFPGSSSSPPLVPQETIIIGKTITPENFLAWNRTQVVEGSCLQGQQVWRFHYSYGDDKLVKDHLTTTVPHIQEATIVRAGLFHRWCWYIKARILVPE